MGEEDCLQCIRLNRKTVAASCDGRGSSQGRGVAYSASLLLTLSRIISLSIFARRRVPNMVMRNNQLIFLGHSIQSVVNLRQQNLRRVTLRPRYAQSNGLGVAAVKIINAYFKEIVATPTMLLLLTN